jgi:hypothetical protein
MERDIDAAWLDIVAQFDGPFVTARPANGWAVWALAVGLMSLAPVVSMATLPVSLPLAATAMALGGVALHRAGRRGGIGRRRALAGIAVALVPVGLTVLAVLLAVAFDLAH